MSQGRPPPKPPDGWKNILKQTSATSADVTKTFLMVLRDSADAFPPLKSLAGGVIAVWATAERAKSSKSRAKAIADRCCNILRIVADVVKDPNDVPPEMSVALDNFKILLGDIQQAIRPLQKQTLLKSLSHLNRDQDELDGLNRRLDEAYHSLMISAAVLAQLKLARIQNEVAKTLVMLGRIDHMQDHTIARLTEIRGEVSDSTRDVVIHSDHILSEIQRELGAKVEVINRGLRLNYLLTLSVGLF